MLLQLVVIDGQIRCVDLWSHGRSGAQLGKYYYNGPIFYLFQEIQIPLMTISKDNMQKQTKGKKKDSLLKVNG